MQARMRSQRLPGKVLRPLAGKPLLQYVLERVQRAERLDAVVVCTSTEPDDDPIASFCQAGGVACFRGDHDDVAGRYLGTVEQYGFDAFIRICGDSPLIDSALIDHGLGLLADGAFEIVTNNLRRTFPAGQTIEIFETRAYRRGYEQMRRPEHLEHVTRYFYDHPEGFRILNFTADEDHSGLGMTIDTPEDFDRIEEIVRRMDRPHWQYGWRDVLADVHALQG